MRNVTTAVRTNWSSVDTAPWLCCSKALVRSKSHCGWVSIVAACGAGTRWPAAKDGKRCALNPLPDAQLDSAQASSGCSNGRCCEARKPLDSPPLCGPVRGWQRGLSSALASITTPIMFAVCCMRSASLLRNRLVVRWNATRRRLANGGSSNGPRLKKSVAPEGLAGVPGRKRLSHGPAGAAQLGPGRPNPGAVPAWPLTIARCPPLPRFASARSATPCIFTFVFIPPILLLPK